VGGLIIPTLLTFTCLLGAPHAWLHFNLSNDIEQLIFRPLCCSFFLLIQNNGERKRKR